MSSSTKATFEPKQLTLSTCVSVLHPDIAATTPVSSKPYARPLSLIARQRSGDTISESSSNDDKQRSSIIKLTSSAVSQQHQNDISLVSPSGSSSLSADVVPVDSSTS
ncbi:unnamed protein product [Phytophthora fragariaefolia]|uniref:Unnamed protein product n=1 Tax=Phytophthora fragariaefolia TaxID=1490495 RepID=A0A9W6WSU5_9STRA|nr:unnamed protein product [Phytophthora fragariaefolia]